jgi:hypothetical protein
MMATYLYVTSGSGLRKKPAITLCAFECTRYVGGWVGHGGGEKGIVWSLREIEPRFLGNLFRAPTIVLTEPSRFAH